MSSNPKVLIAGAGPVGLTLANEMARHGVPVRIVDKAPAATDKSKALVLWSRTLELFDDAGYAAPFMPSGFQVHGAQISNGKDVVARVTLDSIDSRFPYALMIPQCDTERVLEERLAAHGVKVERSTELLAFADKGNAVEATLKKPDSSSETLSADWLVGCDGAHSAVRHGLGFAFEGTTMDSQWMLADGHVAGLAPKDKLHIFWHRDGMLAFFPIIGDRFRVIADAGTATEGPARPTRPWRKSTRCSPIAATPGVVMSDPFWLACFRINERKVQTTARAASSWRATPPTSTARPAARA